MIQIKAKNVLEGIQGLYKKLGIDFEDFITFDDSPFAKENVPLPRVYVKPIVKCYKSTQVDDDGDEYEDVDWESYYIISDEPIVYEFV